MLNQIELDLNLSKYKELVRIVFKIEVSIYVNDKYENYTFDEAKL